MDPVTVSAKECVTIGFSLCPYSVQWRMSSFLSLHFYTHTAKMADSKSKTTKECHVNCRSQLNQALRARNAKQSASSTSSLLSNFTSRLSTPITSSASFMDRFYIVAVAILLLGFFLFGLFLLCFVFRFPPLLQSDPITTETFAVSSITPS